ncbi:MAG: class I SAM-dependent methyltransferase [Methanotrichaceae archaeon]
MEPVNSLRLHFCDFAFNFLQSLGFHLSPNHYYWPIPDTRFLKDELWQRESSLPGIDINETQQLQLLSDFARLYKEEYEKIPRSCTDSLKYYINNESFTSVDGEILYCMIRHFKPKKIIEIGSGNSTLLSARAIQTNGFGELTAIEPYPDDALKNGFPGLSKLIDKKLEEVPLSEFEGLQANDILFIDSSHVLKIGSDVQYEYLEILPRLKPGVLVHVHDIFLPMEYPKHWILKNHHFWNEQYLLQAFLICNSAWHILWAGSYMHIKHPDLLEKNFGSYDREKRWPGSFWMQCR